MSGDNRMVIVNVTAIHGAGWPNGLAVDYETSRIYWIDARLACHCFVALLRIDVILSVLFAPDYFRLLSPHLLRLQNLTFIIVNSMDCVHVRVAALLPH
jgi:hypothetical protein